jgi:hypothetical protein
MLMMEKRLKALMRMLLLEKEVVQVLHKEINLKKVLVEEVKKMKRKKIKKVVILSKHLILKVLRTRKVLEILKNKMVRNLVMNLMVLQKMVLQKMRK